MRTAVMTLGIVGGIFGLLGATMALGGSLWLSSRGLAEPGMQHDTWWALLGFGLALLGIAAGATAGRHPARAACGFVVAALGLVLAIHLYAALTVPLFLAAAVLAFIIHADPARTRAV